jgi:formate hydrogenlyase subunit 3/multisubunit Na+/H+ antiporter MnhD subunit
MTAGAALLVASFAGYACAALVGTASVPRRLVDGGRESAGWVLNLVAGLAALAAGAIALSGHTVSIGPADLGTGLGEASLRLDRLSGLFTVITFAVATAACLANVQADVRRARPRLTATVAFAMASVLLVLSADHLFTLLFGWEGLTFAFLLLAGFDRRRLAARRATVLAGTFGKISGAFLLAGGALAAASVGGLTFTDLASTGSHAVPMALLLVGFGIKVGVVPVQVWLPTTYATAPARARALMAGAAVNVGFYGMWRTLEIFGPAPAWIAVVVLVVGGVTAILGIAHAAVHPDLRGLIAWSSVENAGVISAGFGVALAGSATGEQELVAAGLLAASAQVIAHALGKSLLFVSAAAVERARGTTDLETCRGLAHDLPWAGAGLVVGALTLAGLPLTAGFASEWLTLETLMQQFRIDDLAIQLASATAGALVALSVGVAGVTFVRLVALTVFSPRVETRQRPPSRAATGDGRWAFRSAVLLLGLGCLGVAAAAPWEVDAVAAGMRPLVGTAGDGAHKSPFVLQPVYDGFSSLSPSWLWLVLPAFTAIAALVAIGFSGPRVWRVRRVTAWSSASPGVHRGVGYTSFGYANPMRKVLSNILLTRAQLHVVEEAERVEAVRLATVGSASGTGSASASTGAAEVDESGSGAVERAYQIDVVEVVERYLYRPAYVVLSWIARMVTRLQSGRLDAYMAYMLVVLLAAIALVATLT